MKIGIDFDHVLFDTEKFKRQLFNRFGKFDNTYSDAKDENGNYQPERHAEILDVSLDEFHKVIREDAESCVYSDVEKLAELENHEVVIVSRGDTGFQSMKIKESGVNEIVDAVVVVEEKPKDVVDINFLVDDSEEELEQVDIPGFQFDRSKHTMEDIIEKVGEFEA